METSAFSCWVLFLLIYPVVPMCLPTEFTLFVEKPECDYCVAINTTICMGVCFTRDSNMRDIFRSRFVVQRSCTYDKVEYRTVILPGCAIDSNPAYTYPVAISCHCGACRTERDECTRRVYSYDANCAKPVRRVYPYPGQSNYMIPF
ncbi:thyroid stimulating hormone subunit beta a isoform X1 [Poecilia reticulata]|uniref:thyroid stimulating hormone subunit beta a isoform X1 n=2 Tax=Poecilia reticulata TaxID=8081 RepID=UPI0004A36588|nr:PREDICTED: thyrotropin subunit beta isoform X1 [Poecilia reticulata]